MQTLYDEAITSTCGHPPASPTISNYTFASATPTASGMTLMFQEKAGDKPGASLVIGLTAAGAIYQAQLIRSWRAAHDFTTEKHSRNSGSPSWLR